jgi:hypothetical protein
MFYSDETQPGEFAGSGHCSAVVLIVHWAGLDKERSVDVLLTKLEIVT